MERSAELEAVMRRVVRLALLDADARREMWLRNDEIVGLGTDPREVWIGFETINRITDQQVSEMPDAARVPVEFDHLSAFQIGDTAGWAVAVMPSSTGDGSNTRLTAVFELVGTHWKIVHDHWSFGTPNEESFPNQQVTVTVDDIADDVARSRPDMSGAASADGTVTLLFSDIEGSTVMLNTLGDRRYKAMLQWHNDVARAALADAGGHEVNWQGDGFMFAFGSARRALRCATAIHAAMSAGNPEYPKLRLRMGIHTGEALRDRDDFFGHAVHYAARVASAATGGQTLCSDLVRQLLSGNDEWIFTPVPSQKFKGFQGEQTLFEVRAAESADVT